MIVRGLLASGLLAGIALGVPAPVASAAPAQAPGAECAHIQQRHDLNRDREREHRSAWWTLVAQARTASGADRRSMLSRAEEHSRAGAQYRGWRNARAGQLVDRCGAPRSGLWESPMGMIVPGEGPPSAECVSIRERYDHNGSRVSKHLFAFMRLDGEARAASGEERRTLQHRADTHRRLTDQYSGWRESRERQLESRCGYAFPVFPAQS